MNQSNDLWGALAVRGLLAILFGVAAVFWPGLTLVTLIYLFSAFVLANGLITLVLSLTNLGNSDRSLVSQVLWTGLGVAEVAVGVYLLRHMTVVFSTFLLIVGFILVARGLVELFNSFFEDTSGANKTASTIGGLASVIVGVVVLLQPAASGVAFVWILGLYALIVGPLLLAMSHDLKENA